MSTSNNNSNNTLTDRQSLPSSVSSPSPSPSSASVPARVAVPCSSSLPSTTSLHSTPGAAVNCNDRHALTQEPLDNHILNWMSCIVNSSLNTTAYHGESASNDDGNNTNHGGNNDDVEQQHQQQQQQYMLFPVDLLVSVDKSNKPTVKAALPSSFAFPQQTAFPLSFFSAYAPPPSMASIPTAATLTPQIAPLSTAAAMASIPQIAALPQLASVPLSALPSPSIPLSILMSQPQQQQLPTTATTAAAAVPLPANSLLNPSAASFTPTMMNSYLNPFVHAQALTPSIAPISEIREIAKTQTTLHDSHDAEDMDAWCLMDEHQNQQAMTPRPEYYNAPNPTHSNNEEETVDSFVYQRQDNRVHHRQWRKPHEFEMNPIPPRWRAHQHQKENMKPAALGGKHLHISYRVNKTLPEAVKSKPKLCAEFVEHVTLPNRENYPPDTVFTKTWAMKNSGELEWGYHVELVYVKGDENLSLEKRVPVNNAQSGETVHISTTIKTPSIPGRYCTYFRLQKAGRFFGPRVWCDIIVGGVNPNLNALQTRLNAPHCANEMAMKADMVNHDKILTQRAALRWKKKYAAKGNQVPSYYKFVTCK